MADPERTTRTRNVFALALRAMSDVLSPFYTGASWAAWRVVLTAAAGLPCPDAEAFALFRQCTARATWPTAIAERLTLICGRRAGKDRIVALLAVAAAAFMKYALSPGERGVVMVLAVDRAQARVTFRYIRALFSETPMLKALVESETKESLSLTNGIDIEVHTSDFRRVRGRTVVLAILNEIAFWDTSEEAASPDAEVLNAIEPAMATVPNSLLVMISSPHARRGVLWNQYQAHYGQDHPEALVWQAATRVMNPLVPQAVIDRAYAEDDALADAEYGGQFRKDLEDFVRKDVLDAVTVPDRREMPPQPGVPYLAFTDPSGGSSDSFTLAIAHMEGSRAVLDLLRETRAPFDPDLVTEDYAGLIRRYGLRTVTGDAYAGEWPRSRFAAFGVTYQVSGETKTELYRGLLPLLNAGSVALLRGAGPAEAVLSARAAHVAHGA